MRYQPRRSSARWLEGAPAPVIACYDNGGKSFDRYTVLYGAPLFEKGDGREAIPYRGMSENPFHPQGFGMWGEMPAWNRAALGKKIRFLDLPPDAQRCVRLDCRADDTWCDWASRAEAVKLGMGLYGKAARDGVEFHVVALQGGRWRTMHGADPAREAQSPAQMALPF